MPTLRQRSIAVAQRPREEGRRQRDGVLNALMTTADNGHAHCAVFHELTGDGLTTAGPNGHRHEIRGLDVLPADGHTHELTMRRCFMHHTAGGNHGRMAANDNGL